MRRLAGKGAAGERDMHPVRRFVLDALANYIFFVPMFIALNTTPFFLGLAYWNLENVVTYLLTSLFGSFMMGGVFGRFLDVWRKKLKYR